ncbi:hypothetical protein [Serratia fonticola]
MNVLTYEQLKAQLDAVVAENVALKEFIKKEYSGTMVRVINDDGPAGWDCIDCSPRTPETNAALAEVEDKAIEKFIAKKLKQLEAMHPDTHAFGATAMSIRAQINELQAYVVELREGRV